MRYEDKTGIMHSCESAQMVPNDRSTFLVWTMCGKDVPAGKGFEGRDRVTCSKCEDESLLLIHIEG